MGNTNTENFIETLKQKNINDSDYIYACLDTKCANIQDKFYEDRKRYIDSLIYIDKNNDYNP